MIDETTLAKIFSKPPPYTPDELSRVIEKFRASRTQFVTQAKAPKEAKAKGPKASVDLSNLEL